MLGSAAAGGLTSTPTLCKSYTGFSIITQNGAAATQPGSRGAKIIKAARRMSAADRYVLLLCLDLFF